MLYTSYFGNKRLLELKDCIYISIAVSNPKYKLPYEVVDFKPLKPYGIFGRNLTDEQYIRLYYKRLNEIGADKIKMELIKTIGIHANAVLLCHEKNGSECHRRDFAKWFYSKTGCKIPELSSPDGPKNGVKEEKKAEKSEDSSENSEKCLDQITIFDIM